MANVRTRCQKDSGSMYGCEPVCDSTATHLVTVEHCGSVPTLTYVSCERHAATFAVWPDRATVRPLSNYRQAVSA